MKKNRRNINELKIFALGIIGILSLIFIINFVSAATYYWVGVNNGKWGNSSSWASSSGGVMDIGYI